MAVTIKELADILGLSISAVSKALNGYTDIGQGTKNRVFEAAAKYGYKPNAMARGLKTGRSYNLGLVYTEDSGSGLTHNYFSPILESFRTTAESQGYDISFISRSVRPGGGEPLSYLQHSRYRNVDGICVVCCDFNDPQIINLMQKCSIPIVTIDEHFKGHPCVMSSNSNGMKDLVEYVISMGHEKIALVYGNPSSSTKQRYRSFLRTMEKHGLTVPEEYLIESLYHNPSATSLAVEQLLKLDNPPTCILLPDDFAALGVLEPFERHGIALGRDISVAGFDGVPLLQMLKPKITTVAQNTRNIGKKAAQLLISKIENPEIDLKDKYHVATKLIIGGTVAKIKTL